MIARSYCDETLPKFTEQTIVNLVRAPLNKVYAKRGGRQSSMFISENICTIFDLFDKAVEEGGEIITMETRSEGDDET